MLRSIILISALLSALFCWPQKACAAKRFGLGIVVAGPTGLTSQYIYSKNKALVASVGWGEDYLHLNLDHLWAKRNLIKVDNVPISFYYGAGIRWIQNDDSDSIGVRVPLGVQHIFKEVPIQIFMELVPVLVLVENTAFEIDIALGARYFF